VPQRTTPAHAVATRYLQALARQDWDEVTGCLATEVIRHGPFGDDFNGATAYVSFLQRTMPSLPGYRMEVDRVTALGDQRAMVELRETITPDSGALITHECLLFEIDADGLLREISVYIRQAPQS
jgi:predicted ester cyclase